MTDPTDPNPRRAVADAEAGIDLGQLVRAIWRRRLLMLAAVFGGALLGIGYSVLSTKYVSEGLLLMPDLSVGDYKRYESALANAPRLERFLAHEKDRDAESVKALRSLLLQPGAMAQAVRPEFTFTDRDARQYGVRAQQSSGLMGVRLRLTQRDRTGTGPLGLLADYVRDTAIQLDSETRLLKWCQDYTRRELELRNTQLLTEFNVEQQEQKIAGLRAILERTPASPMPERRELVSLENGGERYLSPAAQLVAAEVLQTDYALEQTVRARARVIAGLKRDYYCQARDALLEPGSGRAFLQRLETIHAAVLDGQDLASSAVEHTANVFELQRLRWSSDYLVRTRFVVSPEGAQVRERRPGRTVGAILGAIAGFLLGAVASLALAWWRQNRAVIVAED